MVARMDEQRGRCDDSGVPLVIVRGEQAERKTSWKASRERKNPRLGYTNGNVVFVALEFNTAVSPRADPPSTAWTPRRWRPASAI